MPHFSQKPRFARLELAKKCGWPRVQAKLSARRPRAPRTRRRWRAGTCGSDTRAHFRAAHRTRSERRRIGSRRWRRACETRDPLTGTCCSPARGPSRVALAEPLLALRAGAVREGFLVHVALHAFLDGVVTHGGGRGQRFVDVAALDELARAVGVMRPDAGVTIRLQFHLHLQRVRLGFGRLLLRGAHLVGDAGHGLHVMADLVRDDVRLGEVALRGELGFELPEEREVDVHLVVGGAVERPRGGGGRAAAGVDAVRRTTARCGAGYCSPCSAENRASRCLRCRRARARRTARPRRWACRLPRAASVWARSAAATEQAHDEPRIDAEEIGADDGDETARCRTSCRRHRRRCGRPR